MDSTSLRRGKIQQIRPNYGILVQVWLNNGILEQIRPNKGILWQIRRILQQHITAI
jgi:hypothetical protein